jgi:hypothetical protein
LRSRNVDYVAVHGAFIPPDKFKEIVAILDRRADMALVLSAPWEGSESRRYRLGR